MLGFSSSLEIPVCHGRRNSIAGVKASSSWTFFGPRAQGENEVDHFINGEVHQVDGFSNHGNPSGAPPKATPPRNKALLMAY